VGGLHHCPRLQRIFLSNNRIEKFESIATLKEATQLSELALDGNPIAHHKNYFEYCLSITPNLKTLDLRKITQEMREPPKSEAKPKQLSPDEKLADSGASTEISPEK